MQNEKFLLSFFYFLKVSAKVSEFIVSDFIQFCFLTVLILECEVEIGVCGGNGSWRRYLFLGGGGIY